MLCEKTVKNAGPAPFIGPLSTSPGATPSTGSRAAALRARTRLPSTANRVARSVLALAGHQPALIQHTETPWASITFSGNRHTITLRFEGTEAISSGEQLIAALPDHEFVIPGKLVADAIVTSADHRCLPHESLEVTLEILLLDDA